MLDGNLASLVTRRSRSAGYHWPYRLAVRTLPSQGRNASANLAGVIRILTHSWVENHSVRCHTGRMRRCTKCEVEKPLTEFTRRKAGGRFNSWCRECTVRATREGRRKNKEIRERNKRGNDKRRRALKTRVARMKADPCMDCGRSFNPWQMHLDHTAGDKVKDIATLAHRGATNLLEEELKKVEPVCACCHADRTYFRRIEVALKTKKTVVVLDPETYESRRLPVERIKLVKRGDRIVAYTIT